MSKHLVYIHVQVHTHSHLPASMVTYIIYMQLMAEEDCLLGCYDIPTET